MLFERPPSQLNSVKLHNDMGVSKRSGAHIWRLYSQLQALADYCDPSKVAAALRLSICEKESRKLCQRYLDAVVEVCDAPTLLLFE